MEKVEGADACDLQQGCFLSKMENSCLSVITSLLLFSAQLVIISIMVAKLYFHRQPMSQGLARRV
jgi:hypothetical protein